MKLLKTVYGLSNAPVAFWDALVNAVEKLGAAQSSVEAAIYMLDMDPEAALARGLARRSGEDRFEDFGLPFQKALRDGFHALADQFPGRCRLIDAGRAPEAIAADVLAAVQAALP